MPLLIRNLVLEPGSDERLLIDSVLSRLSIKRDQVTGWRIVRKAVDARNKQRIKVVYTIELSVQDEASLAPGIGSDPSVELVSQLAAPVFRSVRSEKRIVIAGFGPAGIFAGLRLAEYGLAPVILERGRPMEARVADVQRFWKNGVLDVASNVQFGEGGAGTFSDGKLTTRVRDENIGYVLTQLVRFGAPDEILWLAKPHIGTDRLRAVVVGIRGHLAERGIAIRFNSRLSDIQLADGGMERVVINNETEERCDILVLAPGHSARDTYRMLHARGVCVERKPFSIGFRVEHPQELINSIQYGRPEVPGLPPAEYSLAWNNRSTGRSAYSFCMCPGGMVVAGSSEAEGVVTNGMSNYRRNEQFANSALVVNVGPADFDGDSPLAGMEFQRRWEHAAFVAGGRDYRAPAQNMMSFLGFKGAPDPVSSYRPGVVAADLSRVVPPYVAETLREGLASFDRKMRGFVTAEATLTGVETRTSAPLRIVRNDDLQSVNVKGLYPAGEGAGYAGGIMSAALDGIRVADAIAAQLQLDC